MPGFILIFIHSKLSTFKLQTYSRVLFPIIWRLHVHLHSFTQITDVHGGRGFSKDQQQGRTDYLRKRNPCWRAAGYLPMASSSNLPSLLH